MPSGLHSGWKTDSAPADPATRRSPDTAPLASRSATHSSDPSHGRYGRSHVSHASFVPSGEMRGVEKKSRPPTTIDASPEPSVGMDTISFTTSSPS